MKWHYSDEAPTTVDINGREAMTTGKKAASKASKELRSKTSTAGEKTVAGSDLSQARGRKPPTKGRR
jgi:hypothetical protein